jgi:L-ascorbate metabolism protein UlaG (beta-lactamase superfamily)
MTVKLRRLAWAGLEVQTRDGTAVVDLVEDFSRLHGATPPSRELPPSPRQQSADVALLTHLHADHADIAAVERALRSGGSVIRPEAAFGGPTETALVDGPETALAASGLRTQVLRAWETMEVGPFSITALPAADGFGDPQVSWCIAAGGVRILHAGDTVFHGWWWLAAQRYGPFDVAFLPAGGAVVDLSPRQPPSPLPAGMDPRQAAVAGKLLAAKQVVPIHYGPLHEADNYKQANDPAGTFEAATRELGVEARMLRPGETISVQPSE